MCSSRAGGVRLCGLALSSYSVLGNATITGSTVNGAVPTPATAMLPAYPGVLIVSVDATWQAVTNITITTAGLRGVSLWGLYY
jgi:hypothetical protein